ncbi:integrase catalytic domain-containing protein [Trichonephila clavipes]|nr:integrase catalytic domain-containing protein [Trichonephila clavipes]
MAYVIRFCKNVKRNPIDRKKGILETDEIKTVEKVFFKEIQREEFSGREKFNFRTMKYNDDLLRVETRIASRKDLETFRFPILLPHKHQMVEKLIMSKHLQLEHAAVSIPLPEDRVRDAVVFEVTGIDLCGPLFLKTDKKCWIVFATCAVYQTVHLELVSSLSTECFILALRRFIARRGRPTTIYSDNEKNLVGTANLLQKIDWKKIENFASEKKDFLKIQSSCCTLVRWFLGKTDRIIEEHSEKSSGDSLFE